MISEIGRERRSLGFLIFIEKVLLWKINIVNNNSVNYL